MRAGVSRGCPERQILLRLIQPARGFPLKCELRKSKDRIRCSRDPNAVAVLLKLAGAPLFEIYRVEHISGAGRMIDRSLHVSCYTYCLAALFLSGLAAVFRKLLRD